MSNFIIDPETQCWIWQGALSDGYGRVYWEGKRIKAHRWFYKQYFGDIPKWEDKSSPEIDHICKNRACVNPEHLRLVSAKENVLRGIGPTAINARKTHCIHGHLLPTEPNSRGGRECKLCSAEYMRSERRREYKRKYYHSHK